MNQRLKTIAIFFGFWFLIVFFRLFYWQVISHASLSALAEKQYSKIFEVPAERGKIYSSDNFPLVLNEKSYLLYTNPSKVLLPSKDLEDRLNKILVKKITVDEKIFKDKNIFWYPLAENLSLNEKEKIFNLKINGLGFEDRQKRFYPEASMSAHLLGFVGNDENENQKGYFGLEGYYNNELKGKTGFRYFEQDALGRPIPQSGETEEKPVLGRDLVLNIDRPVQYLAESQLRDGIEKYKAKSGFLAIVDPSNGSVIAMAAYPNFELDKYFEFDNEIFRNPVVSSTFEPGSIFKLIVMASALDAKVIYPQERCNNCGGPRKIADYSIKTWNEKYYPNSTMTDILVHSDNVGMIYVIEKLGVNGFVDYFNKFGFDQKTGIDLQGEAVPVVRKKDAYSSIDLATASFGQGIAVTPIQMLMAVSAIANKGELVTPSVVKYLKEGEKIIEINKNKKRVISETASEEITKMMVATVENGEAKWAKPKNYKIAGKTGTAQIPISGHYDPEKTIASFIGFAPVENPRFVMLVCLVEPKTSTWGSETAAPLWFKIAQDIFRVWGIKPDI